jgi:hypothetical protein
MATKLKLEIAGVIENMAGFVTPAASASRSSAPAAASCWPTSSTCRCSATGAADDGSARAGRRRPAGRVRRSRVNGRQIDDPELKLTVAHTLANSIHDGAEMGSGRADARGGTGDGAR